MNTLKKLYKDSTRELNRKHVDAVCASAYIRAKQAASQAKSSAEYRLPDEVPRNAWDGIINRLRIEHEMVARIEEDEDNFFIATLYMSGWAN
ncbi:MAG: hypothetical protein ACRC9Y_07320 [Aeromonas veronii]